MNHRSYWGYWSAWPLGQPGGNGVTGLEHLHLTLSSLFHHPPVWPIDTIIFCKYYDTNLAIYTNPTTQTYANHKRDKNPIWTSSTTDTVPLLDCLPFLFSGFSSLLGNKKLACKGRGRLWCMYECVGGCMYILLDIILSIQIFLDSWRGCILINPSQIQNTVSKNAFYILNIPNIRV